jgi:hypothetical protein
MGDPSLTLPKAEAPVEAAAPLGAFNTRELAGLVVLLVKTIEAGSQHFMLWRDSWGDSARKAVDRRRACMLQENTDGGHSDAARVGWG